MNKTKSKSLVLSLLGIWLLSLVCCVFLLRTQYLNTSLEIINAWSQSNSIEIQQGNILSSVTKNQRILVSSQIIDGVKVIDKSQPTKSNVLVSFGQTKDLYLSSTNQKFSGIFAHQIQFHIPNSDLVVLFNANPQNGLLVLTAIASGLSLIYFLAFLVIKARERLKNQETIDHLRLKAEVANEIEKLSSQVAHDIKSPLAAMKIALSAPASKHDKIKPIVQNSIQRIQEISSNLSLKAKEAVIERPSNISSIISEIVEEKNLEYQNCPDVKITYRPHKSIQNFKALMNSPQLKRIISNLINNSIESKNKASIEVKITAKVIRSHAYIRVSDNGRGMPQTVLNALGKRGISTKVSKVESGLGLFHAMETLTKYKAKLNVTNTSEAGTDIDLRLKTWA